MAYCNNCKQDKSDDQKFCDSCGAELSASTTAEPAPATQPAAPQQPVYTAEQFQQHKEQAMNIFSKLGIGLQIAVVGALASFIFTLITIIIGGRSYGVGAFSVSVGVPGFTWMFLIAAAVNVGLIYLIQMKSGKPRAMLTAVVIALGAIWAPLFFMGFLEMYSGLFIVAVIGGIAQLVGGFIALNESL
jgi:hypothetical protein